MSFFKNTERSVFASDPEKSQGRLIFETPSPTRSEFQRDRDRIIHSAAFRRLKHKTQVFVHHEGDHYRTRLTHTLEVSQIARALARSLGLDEDLAEALALSHDLGHTPFGHAGEDALQQCLTTFGGFDHNAQALRIVTRLERRYAQFDGLNLTWETLEGLVKHNGPLLTKEGSPTERYQKHGISEIILEMNQKLDFKLNCFASAEAQAAAVADDIAYNAHDLDDGLRAGLFSFDDLKKTSFLAEFLKDIDDRYPNLENQRRIYELTRRVITYFVEDIIKEGQQRLDALLGVGANAVREAPYETICFSGNGKIAEQEVKQFLYAHMYHHPDVMTERKKAETIVDDLFTQFMKVPEALPEDWRQGLNKIDQKQYALHIADYIAGMTDHYAVLEHKRLFDHISELR